MAKKIFHQIATEFPDYVQLNELLRIAAITWPKFGISAVDLSEMDGWTFELLKASLTK